MERKKDSFKKPIDVEQDDEDGDPYGQEAATRANIKMSVSHAKIAGTVSKKRRMNSSLETQEKEMIE
jgi:hypothetical protein